jgi:hypothetical protein
LLKKSNPKLLFMAIGSDSYTWHGNINIHTRKRTIFIEQMPTYLVFKKVHSMLASEYSTVYHAVLQALMMKRQNIKQHEENT